MLAALGVLVPGRSPAATPMDIVFTTWRYTTLYPTNLGPLNFTFVFTFNNITTTLYTVATSYTGTTTIVYYTPVTYIWNVTISSTKATTVTTHTVTKTSGTTTVPSTSTTWTTITGTATNRTVTATASETTTQTFYTTTGVTTTSIYTVTGATAPTPPPIPGFPLESILAGLGLGLLGVHLVFRNRRANKKRPT